MNAAYPYPSQLLAQTWADAKGFLSLGIQKALDNIRIGYETEHTANDQHATIHATGTIAERGRSTPMGDWIIPSFSNTNFTVSANSSWAVTTGTYVNTPLAYTLVGSTCKVQIYVANSHLTVNGTVNSVSIRLPASLVPAAGLGAGIQFSSLCHIINNGNTYVGELTVSNSSPIILVQSPTNFVTSTDFAIRGQLDFQITT